MNSFDDQMKLVDDIFVSTRTSVSQSCDASQPPFWEAPQLPIGSKTFDSGTRQCRLNGARAAPRPVMRMKIER